MLPPVADLDEANHLLGLVMRHFNSIVLGLEQVPPALYPLWPITHFDAGEFEDAETWAYGFTEAVKLSPSAWQPLFDHRRAGSGTGPSTCWVQMRSRPKKRR
jgi:uncharacterized protein